MINIEQHKTRKIPSNLCSNCNSPESIKWTMGTPSYDYLINLLKDKKQSYSLEKDLSNYIEQHQFKEETKKDFVFIKRNGAHEKIILETVLFIESEKNYLTLMTAQKEYRFRSTVKNFMTKLPRNFVKTHKSFIVNSCKVENFNLNFITITGNIKIPISNSCKEDVLIKLKGLLL